MTVLSRLENLRDSVTDEEKPPWPGDFVVSPVAALSIAPMGVTTPCVTFVRATTQTTLGLVLDDPTSHTAISEKIMLLFDGKTIEQSSVALRPRTSFMTSINMPCFQKLAKHHRYMYVSHQICFMTGLC